MMIELPLVTVVMSVYNEEEFHLRESIDSILNQSYKNIEFIIILDNPENKILKAILVEYKIKDNRIILIFNDENIGVAMSLNQGINIANGRYFARMDADDISCIDRLEKEVCFLESNNIDMVCSDIIPIDEQMNTGVPVLNRGLHHYQIKKILYYGCCIASPTVMMRMDILLSLNGYRNFRTSEDYDLWLRMIGHGYKIEVLSDVLLYYRVRKNSITKSDYYRSYLLDKYVLQLFKERNRNGNDSYSEDNFKQYMDKYYYNKPLEIKKFNKSAALFFESVKSLRNKKYKMGIIGLAKSLCINCRISRIFVRLIIYKFLKKVI